jgi:vacuolar-type H+-ATPase subunit E/Vma4
VPHPDAAAGGATGARPLLDALHLKAEAETQARRTMAAAEAARIATDADAHLARHVAAAMAERTTALAALEEAARADCMQRVTRDTLTARAEALDRVFAAAAAQIEARRTHAGLEAALETMISDALSYLPDGPAQLRCTPGAAAAVRCAVARLGRDGLVVREDDTVALGVLAESEGGSIVVDATFARRLARERPRLAITVASQLEAAQQ